MAAVIHPIDIATKHGDVVGGARARAAAVRARPRTRRSAPPPSYFSGDGRLRVASTGCRPSAAPLVANDDLAGVVVGSSTLAPPIGRTSVPARPSLATYRRRRLLVAALFLGVLLAGSWALGALGGGPLAASESGSPSVVTGLPRLQSVGRTTYVVAPGDTLWSIARHLQPDGDVRPLVDALAEARGGRPLDVGERIELP